MGEVGLVRLFVSKLGWHREVIRPGDIALATSLAREVGALLDVSPVGLFEFVWILRGSRRRMLAGHRMVCARLALEGLLAQSDVDLVRLRWPDSTVLDVLSLDELPADAWHEPDRAGLYVAIVR